MASTIIYALKGYLPLGLNLLQTQVQYIDKKFKQRKNTYHFIINWIFLYLNSLALISKLRYYTKLELTANRQIYKFTLPICCTFVRRIQ